MDLTMHRAVARVFQLPPRKTIDPGYEIICDLLSKDYTACILEIPQHAVVANIVECFWGDLSELQMTKQMIKYVLKARDTSSQTYGYTYLSCIVVEEPSADSKFLGNIKIISLI